MKKTRIKQIFANLLITLIVGFVYFFVELPAINLQDENFYYFFLVLSVTYCVAAIVTSGFYKSYTDTNFLKNVISNFKIPVFSCVALFALVIIGTVISSPILRASAYSELLPFENGDFAEDIVELSYDNIPMLDRDSAQQLANRKLGELSEMVSQFEVSYENNQINYEHTPVRVVPLVYADLIKWITNRSEGLPAYILIDMVTQQTELVRLDEGMRYSKDEHLMRNLDRHLRFNYPTFMFDTPTFEIDDEGNPYWVAPRIVKTIGLFGGRDAAGAVLVNAVTGECTYYEAQGVPQWVDRVVSAELIIEQYDYYGMYNNGFINSIFGQRDVTVTTDGYNYLAMNDDIYVYTGVTSVGSDQSNIGFLLANQRTKETSFYSVAGAEEYSAMSSAQGVVQHLNYNATFPLLLNISGEPTYFMALKDAAGLVKMYAMVNVRQYQIVSTGDTVEECELKYIELLSGNNITQTPQIEKTQTDGVVEDIRHIVLEGQSHFYIKLEDSDVYYSVNAAESEISVLLNVGDEISLSYEELDGSAVYIATELVRTKAVQIEQEEPVAEMSTANTEEQQAQESAASTENTQDSESVAENENSQEEDDSQENSDSAA